MPIRALDHIYVETRNWDESVTFWRGLGFEFADRWGDDGHRAGRLVTGNAVVVLAEVDESTDPAFNAFFSLTAAGEYTMGEGVEVEQTLTETHWGTRWIRVRDPEGRIFCLEETASGG